MRLINHGFGAANGIGSDDGPSDGWGALSGHGDGEGLCASSGWGCGFKAQSGLKTFDFQDLNSGYGAAIGTGSVDGWAWGNNDRNIWENGRGVGECFVATDFVSDDLARNITEEEE